MTDPVAALREAFGSAPDTSTLKGLIHYGQQWLAESENAPTKELSLGLETMAGVLERARIATVEDLKSAGDPDESLRERFERLISIYRQLEPVVAELAVVVSNEQRGEARSLFVALEAASQQFAAAQQAMDDWLKEPVLRCLRCGGSKSDPCPDCGLELLFPDVEESPRETGVLPAAYAPVYQAYTAVLKGEHSLRTVIAALGPLGGHLRNQLAMVNSSLLEETESESLAKFQTALEEALEGLALMQETQETRSVRDLRNGWTGVFRAALTLEKLKVSLVMELGSEEERAQIQPDSNPIEDKITLTGED